MGSPNLIKTPTVTKTTLAAATVTLVQATNTERTLIGLHNESGATIWFAFAESAPANTDTMEPLPDATGIYFEANSGLSRANLYAYSVAGGVVKTSEAL